MSAGTRTNSHTAENPGSVWNAASASRSSLSTSTRQCRSCAWWYLRYPLSYRDIEDLFLERGIEVDHSTLNRWVLDYAPLIERRLRVFRKLDCGSVRID